MYAFRATFEKGESCGTGDNGVPVVRDEAVTSGCGTAPADTSACAAPFSFGVETFEPQGANRPGIEFAPMQTLQKSTTVVKDDNEDDEGKQINTSL